MKKHLKKNRFGDSASPNISALRLVVDHLALISLLQIVLILLLQLSSGLVDSLGSAISPNVEWVTPYIRRAWQMLLYFLTLYLPVCLATLIHKSWPLYASFCMKPALPTFTPLIVCASVGILYAVGYVINLLLGAYMQESSPTLLCSHSAGGIIISFVATVILPAFLEEIVYRGIFLQALLPYGKAFAVITSGLLFGIMHLRFSQLFYATAAGILIGYFTVKGGSLWVGIFIHLANNLLSFILGAVREICGTDSSISFFVERWTGCAVFVLGAVSILILVHLHTRGAFQPLEPSAEYYDTPLALQTALKNFLTPLMTMYLVLSLYMIYANVFSA